MAILSVEQAHNRLRAIARQHPRYGYRRAHVLICRDLPGINVKRVHRLWQQEGLIERKFGPLRRRTQIMSGPTISSMIAVPMGSG